MSTEFERKLAEEINRRAYHPTRERQPGFTDARLCYFDVEKAAEIITEAWQAGVAESDNSPGEGR